MEQIWLILDRGRSPQCKVVIKACIINLINTIWYRRNQSRFQDKLIHWKTAINMMKKFLYQVIILTKVLLETCWNSQS